MADDVRLPRGLLVTLLVLTGLSLGGVAFLLGRESVRGPQQVVVAPATVATEAVPPVAIAPATATATVAAPTAAPAVSSSSAIEPTGMAASSSPAAESPFPSKPLAGAGPIKSYFDAVDKIGPDKLGDDPDKFANELVNGALNGNMSGFTKLIGETELSRRRLMALHPPPSCKDFHQESVAMVSESIKMLQTMMTALKSNDASALTAISGEAQLMQTRAEALKNHEASIKRQYGIR